MRVGVAHAFLAGHPLALRIQTEGIGGRQRIRVAASRQRHFVILWAVAGTATVRGARANERITLPQVAVQDEGAVAVRRGAVEHVHARRLSCRGTEHWCLRITRFTHAGYGGDEVRMCRIRNQRVGVHRVGVRNCAISIRCSGVAEGYVRRYLEAEPGRLHAVVETGVARVLGALATQFLLVHVLDRRAVFPAQVCNLVTDRQSLAEITARDGFAPWGAIVRDHRRRHRYLGTRLARGKDGGIGIG